MNYIIDGINIFIHIIPETFNVDKLNNMNKVTSFLKNIIEENMIYENLDMNKSDIISFSDVSHATNTY